MITLLMVVDYSICCDLTTFRAIITTTRLYTADSTRRPNRLSSSWSVRILNYCDDNDCDDDRDDDDDDDIVDGTTDYLRS